MVKKTTDKSKTETATGSGSVGGTGDKPREGMKVIVNSVRITHERLPVMDAIIDRLLRVSSTNLRNLTSDNVEVSLDQISSVRFGEYLDSIDMPALMFAVRIEQWNNYCLIALNSKIIELIIDIMMGGKSSGEPVSKAEREYTSIEASLARRFIDQISGALSQAFAPLAAVKFATEKMETNPKFITITRPANAAFLIRMRVTIDNSDGFVDVVIPYATLEPVRDELLQMFAGDKVGNDSIWEEHLATQLRQSEIMLTALLFEQQLPLQKVVNLKVGDTIESEVMADDDIVISCGDIQLIRGHIGKAGDNIAVCLSQGLITAIANQNYPYADYQGG